MDRWLHPATSRRCCRRTCSLRAAWPAAGWRRPAPAGPRTRAAGARPPPWPDRPPAQTRSAGHLPTGPARTTSLPVSELQAPVGSLAWGTGCRLRATQHQHSADLCTRCAADASCTADVLHDTCRQGLGCRVRGVNRDAGLVHSMEIASAVTPITPLAGGKSGPGNSCLSVSSPGFDSCFRGD